MDNKNWLLIAAISGVLGTNASYAAEFDMSGSSISEARVYAKEIKAGETIKQHDDLDVIIKLGKKISAGASKYLRFDLNNNAEFAEMPVVGLTIADSTFGEAAMQNGANDASISITHAGGGKGEGYLIYQVSNENETGDNGNGTNTLGEASTFKLDFTAPNDGIEIDNTDNAVSLKYGIYLTASGAGSSTDELSGVEGEYIKFKNGIVYAVKDSTLTADVEGNYLKFATGNSKGSLGNIKIEADSNVKKLDGTSISVNDVLDKGTFKITAENGFAGLQNASGSYPVSSVYLDKSSACVNGYDDGVATTQSVTKDEAIISADKVFSSSDSHYVCIERPSDGEVPFEKADYVIEFDVEAKGDYEYNPGSANNLGKVKRDGVVFDAPYFSTNENLKASRFMLSNFGSSDAKYTATVQTDKGNVATPGSKATGVITAGTMLHLNASDIASFNNLTRGSVTFTIVASPEDIQGVYQTVNQAGELTSIKMIHEGGNH